MFTVRLDGQTVTPARSSSRCCHFLTRATPDDDDDDLF